MGNPSDFDDMMKASTAEKKGVTSSCCPQNVTAVAMSNFVARLYSILRSLPSPTIHSRRSGMEESAARKAFSSST